MSEEEPKYTLRFRTNEISSEKDVSTAQVQFWPQYAEEFMNSVRENLGREPTLRRVDLMTNEYHSEHVRRLDTESHGPLMNKALDVLS